MTVMTKHRKQPKPISLLLKKNDYQKSTSLVTKLDMVLQSYLKQHNINDCRIGKIQNGSLTIESPTSIWLQRLQFIQSELLTELRQHHPSLIKIKIKVNPELAKVSTSQLKKNTLVKKRATRMSKDIADSFLALAEEADPTLKKALQSLAEFSTNKN